MEPEPVELVWSTGGEPLAAARDALFAALATAGLDASWREWQSADPRAPRYARRASGVTVFVHGRPVDLEPAAIRRAVARRPAPWRLAPHLTPAFALALLPKCPLCWTAYGAVAAALGLQVETSYTWLLAALCVAVAVGLFALWRLPDRLGAATATVGAVAVVCARYLWPAPYLNEGGMVLMLVGLGISMFALRRTPADRRMHVLERSTP